MAEIRITRVPDTVKKELQELSDKTGISLTAYAKIAIKEFVERERVKPVQQYRRDQD